MKRSALLFCVILFDLTSTAQSVCSCLEEEYSNGTWKNFSLTIDTLSNTDSTLSSTYQLWDGQNNVWKDWSREVNTYNSAGQLAERRFYNGQNGPLELEARQLYAYDFQGKRDSSVLQNWSSGQQRWFNGSRIYFSYDASARLVQELISDYDLNAAPFYWRNNSRFDYTYNPAAKRNERLSYDWNSSTNNWELRFKRDYYLTASGQVDSLVVLWQGNTPAEIYSYTYDGNGRLKTTLEWENNGGVWERDYLYTYNYTANGKLQSYTYDRYDNTNGGIWLPYRRLTCSQAMLGQQEEVLSYSLYPNPTAGLLVLELPTNKSSRIQVLDLQGKQLLETTAKESRVELHLENLAAGTYLVDVQQGNLSKRQLLVLQAH